MIKYTKQMKTLLEYKKYFHPPRMRGQSDLDTNWGKHNKVLTEMVIRNDIRDGLHETMK